MLSSLRISQIYVLDQDQALDFYVGKLGLEILTDQDLGFMRFLTVTLPGDAGRQIFLEKPGPPAMDPATADEVRALLTKGRAGGHLFFTTSDCHATYEAVQSEGRLNSPRSRPSSLTASTSGCVIRSAITSGLRRCSTHHRPRNNAASNRLR